MVDRSVVPLEKLEALAAEAPAPAKPAANGQGRNGTAGAAFTSRLDVARWLTARGVEFRTMDRDGGVAYLMGCPFDSSHGGNGETAIWQRADGLTTFECKHNSCQGRRWPDAKAAVGKPDATHYDPPLNAPRSAPRAAPSANGHVARPSSAPRLYAPGDRVRLRDWGNIGTVEADDGGPTISVTTTNPETGTSVTKDQPRDGIEPLDGTATPLPEIEDGFTFCQLAIPEPVELIEGYLHQGSKLSVGGGSKAGKTWFLMDMGQSVAYGLQWQGRATTRARVLYINLEIQRAFCQKRLNTLARERGIRQEAGCFDVWNLRGFATDHREIVAKIVERIADICIKYGLIILDPIYKLLGAADENSARDVAALLNSVERLAVETGAAVAFGAHYSKGNQSGKNAIDRVSGSGVFSRDPDSILNLTEHEETNCYTLDATLRNFPPAEPFVIKWQYPLFVRQDELNPANLKKQGPQSDCTADALLDVLGDKNMSTSEWLRASKWKPATFYRRKRDLEDSGRIEVTPQKRWCKSQP